MKILHTVEYYYPSKGGAQEVVRQISERMAAMGHNVTIATTKLPQRKSRTINGVKVVEFNIKGNAVVGISGERKKYQDYLVSNNFDVVMNYAAQQWASDLAFEVLDKIKAEKVLVPCGYSALNNPDFDDYFKRMPGILKKYDASIYNSSVYQDIKFAREHGIKNLHVIPNGADENEFTTKIDSQAFRKHHGIKGFFLLTVGNHTGAKGHAETLEVFKRLPMEATLMIIGGKSSDGCASECQQAADKINGSIANKKVIILDTTRTETVEALKSANLFLFLSNVESSPLVLFEAAAAGLPFISTAAGNAQEIVKWTGGGKITKTTADELRAGNVKASINPTRNLIVRLWLNPLARKRMASKAHRRWLAKFTWLKIAEQYLKLYQEVMK